MRTEVKITQQIAAACLVLLILLPINSVFFTIPARSREVTIDLTENTTDHAPTSNGCMDRYNQDETTTPLISTRDRNNNKISDDLDTWIHKGYQRLDTIVMFKDRLTQDDITTLRDLGVEIGNIFWYLDMVSLLAVPVPIIGTIAGLPGVLRVENPGRPVLYSDIATPAVKARESNEYSPFTAWELGYQGLGVNIAVMDTGVDNAHPSLTGKWVGGADISKPDPLGIFQDGTFDADDTNGHGTTCTGIAIGTGAPEGKYMGAAPEAKVVDVRIGTVFGYAPGEGPMPVKFLDASLEGIEWIIKHKDDSWAGADPENKGIDILSLSWGIDTDSPSDGSDAYSAALDRLADTGVIVCHAAGNSGPNNDGFRGFSAASNGISVAASDDLDTIDRSDDIIAEYSSRGPRHDNNDGNPYNELKPDITAPGTHIMQVQFDPIGDGSGNGYGSRGSGTSYATPVVAGICAMMLEANPKLTSEVIKEILHLTAERRGKATIPELDPFWNKDFGWGAVDAYKAVMVSASITDVDIIDVNLQCFITELEMGVENITTGTTTIGGVAFSKTGIEIEAIEIAVDNGSWKKVKTKEVNGIYLNWTYELDTTGLENGDHTLKVRAINGVQTSLEHFMELATQNKPRRKDEVGASPVMLSVVLILILAGAMVVYFYHTKRKKN